MLKFPVGTTAYPPSSLREELARALALDLLLIHRVLHKVWSPVGQSRARWSFLAQRLHPLRLRPHLARLAYLIAVFVQCAVSRFETDGAAESILSRASFEVSWQGLRRRQTRPIWTCGSRRSEKQRSSWVLPVVLPSRQEALAANGVSHRTKYNGILSQGLDSRSYKSDISSETENETLGLALHDVRRLSSPPKVLKVLLITHSFVSHQNCFDGRGTNSR